MCVPLCEGWGVASLHDSSPVVDRAYEPYKPYRPFKP